MEEVLSLLSLLSVLEPPPPGHLRHLRLRLLVALSLRFLNFLPVVRDLGALAERGDYLPHPILACLLSDLQSLGLDLSRELGTVGEPLGHGLDKKDPLPSLKRSAHLADAESEGGSDHREGVRDLDRRIDPSERTEGRDRKVLPLPDLPELRAALGLPADPLGQGPCDRQLLLFRGRPPDIVFHLVERWYARGVEAVQAEEIERLFGLDDLGRLAGACR